MAKRFTDTNKYKKPFIRGLKGAYKVLWDYLYHDCDHAGIWIVDFDIAQIYIGLDLSVNKEDALKFFNKDEIRIIEICDNSKWFIPSFIDFQYGELNEKNRAHNSVITILKKYNLHKGKPLISPLEGAKDMVKDKEQDMVKENENEDIIKSETEEKTIEFISEKFGITEMKHFLNYKTIVNCTICQYNKGDALFKHFKDQCYNYFLYKTKAEEKLHAFKTFIGTSEEKYLDGGWNAENWIKKFSELNGESENSHIQPKENDKNKVDYGWNKKRNYKEPDLTQIGKLKK